MPAKAAPPEVRPLHHVHARGVRGDGGRPGRQPGALAQPPRVGPSPGFGYPRHVDRMEGAALHIDCGRIELEGGVSPFPLDCGRIELEGGKPVYQMLPKAVFHTV